LYSGVNIAHIKPSGTQLEDILYHPNPYPSIYPHGAELADSNSGEFFNNYNKMIETRPPCTGKSSARIGASKTSADEIAITGSANDTPVIQLRMRAHAENTKNPRLHGGSIELVTSEMRER